MSNPRSDEYAALLQELQTRYQDLTPGERWGQLTTVAIAVADASALQDCGVRLTEDEFLELSRMLLRKIRRLT